MGAGRQVLGNSPKRAAVTLVRALCAVGVRRAGWTSPNFCISLISRFTSQFAKSFGDAAKAAGSLGKSSEGTVVHEGCVEEHLIRGGGCKSLAIELRR